MAGKIIKVQRPSQEEIREKVKLAKEIRRKNYGNSTFGELKSGGTKRPNNNSYYEKIESFIKTSKR